MSIHKIFVAVLYCFFLNHTCVYSQSFSIEQAHQKIVIHTAEKKISAIITTRKKRKARSDRQYWWYDHDHIHQTYGGYAGPLLDGEYQEFYLPDNSLAASGRFYRGTREGDWTYWYPSGRIREKSEWVNGRLSGRRRVYSQSGRVCLEEEYFDGELDGARTTYDSSGGKDEQYFENGVVLANYPIEEHENENSSGKTKARQKKKKRPQSEKDSAKKVKANPKKKK